MVKSFNISDKDALDKLEVVVNKSQYVEMLILKDILNGNKEDQFIGGMKKSIEYMQKSLEAINETINSSCDK